MIIPISNVANYVQDLQPQFRVLFMHVINNKVPKTLNQKSLILHHMFAFPWHFFMVNDNNKVIPTILQNMCSEICHSIFQTYNYGNITKKKERCDHI